MKHHISRALAIACLSFQAALMAQPMTADEQADMFLNRAKAAEARGDRYTADLCLRLLERADPDRARKIIAARCREKAAALQAEAAAAEAKTNLREANYLYGVILTLDPTNSKARAKLAELKAALGSSYVPPKISLINEKLRRIIIPQITFEDITVGEAIDFLRQRTAELDSIEADPGKRGISFKIQGSASTGPTGSIGAIRIKSLRLTNLPVGQILRYICLNTRPQLEYTVTEDGVLIKPRDPGQPVVPGDKAPAPPPPKPMEWTSKAGTTITAEFVGLDGEAVVLKRDGKEMTVEFSKLTPASVAQAKEMAKRKAHPQPVAPGKLAVDAGNPTAGKLRDLIIPIVSFQDITLEEACEFFEVRAVELSADKKRLRIEVEKMETPPPMIDSLYLTAVPIGVALAYVAEKVHMRLQVEADRVRFVAPKPGVAEGARAADFANPKAAPIDPQTLVIPSVSYEDITMEEAVHFVRFRYKEVAPAGHPGINIVTFVDAGNIRIRFLREKNITVKALLGTIAKATGTRVVFDGPAIEFRPLPENAK